jgi:erythromycin esterase-like protein
MNKLGLLLEQLHHAETELAEEFREVAERQSAEHDIYYLGQTLAGQCERHAEQVRLIAQRFGKDLSEPGEAGPLHNVMAGLREKASELLGHRPEAGLLLLRDLRQLYLMAEEANLHWLVLGQVAQATRDHELLDRVSALHKETLTQIKWLKTRIKEAAPQVLVVAAA